MKYFEVHFAVEAPGELLQAALDILSAMAGEAGFETFEQTGDGLIGYVQQQLLDREALDALVKDFPLPHSTVAYSIREAEYRDWNEEWEQQGFDPIIVDRFVIHDGRHLPVDLPPLATMAIEIHARQAFGTGTHETTRMMVATLAGMSLEGRRVLDCGTGTGILSIVALKAGAREAVGYDIDEWSTENARHNAELNGVDGCFSVWLGNVSVLKEVEGHFDVVLANIHRNILLADMEAMAAKLRPGGQLVISGFLSSDIPMLTEKAKQLGLSMTARRQEAEWMCLTLEQINNNVG